MGPHNSYIQDQWQLQSSRARAYVIVVAMMVLSNCIYYRNTQQLVQEAELADSNLGSVSPQPITSCGAGPKPQIAMMMVIMGHDDHKQHDQYWIAVANRRAYATQHDIPLYLVADQLGSGQHPAWEKLIALQAVFQHSCADWVWMNDADAYIMNLDLQLMDVALNPLQHRHPTQQCNTSKPDIIAAGACLSCINTGSLLLRNTEWTHQFVAESWHVPRSLIEPVHWWEQAAMLHLYSLGDTKQHVCIVQQRAINAFPNVTDCHDGTGTFQDGDFLVHFAGSERKQAIASSNSSWLQAVPLLPTNLPDTSAQGAPIFMVHSYDQSTHTGHGQHVAVSLQTRLYAANSTLPVDFKVYIQPQAEGFSNLGWPIWPEPADLRAKLQRQCAAYGDSGNSADYIDACLLQV